LPSAGGRCAPENPLLMRKAVLVVLCAFGLSCFAPAASAVDVEVGGRILVGGGTPLSNGAFFPGTAFPNNDGSLTPVLPPVQVQQGTDVELVNLDEATVANAHKLVSKKRWKGRWIFQSGLVSRPGDTSLVTTSNLKPGVYPFYCSIHPAMWGQLEIVR